MQSACTLPGQVLIALQLVLGELHLGEVGIDRGLGLLDQRTLALKHRLGIHLLGLGRGHHGLGGHHAGLIILRIDARQQLPGFDRLVILHQHFINKTRDFRRDQGEVGTHICIIGTLLRTAGKHHAPQPVQHRQRQHPCTRHQQRLAPVCRTHLTAPATVPGG